MTEEGKNLRTSGIFPLSGTLLRFYKKNSWNMYVLKLLEMCQIRTVFSALTLFMTSENFAQFS